MIESKIMLCDDHSMIRRGMKLYLQFDLGFRDITETASCNELMNALNRKKYTHLILDIILPDGSTLEVIPVIRKLYPEVHTMVFSMQPPEVYGEALKQYGIKYYLSKTAGEEEILNMLKQFLNNKQPAPDTGETGRQNPFVTLSPRELEILHYLLKGIGTKEISELLNITMSTVSTLKNRILEKTHSKNMKDLFQLATLYNLNF